jgi:hypothetical protein
VFLYRHSTLGSEYETFALRHLRVSASSLRLGDAPLRDGTGAGG